MTLFGFLAIVCVAAAAVPIALVWLIQRHKGPAVRAYMNRELAALREENRRLEARVQVLERVATDPARRLSQEIEDAA